MRRGKQFQEGHRMAASQMEERLLCIHENMEKGRRSNPFQHKNDCEYIFQRLVGLCMDGKTIWTANRQRLVWSQSQNETLKEVSPHGLCSWRTLLWNPFPGRTKKSPGPVLTAIIFDTYTLSDRKIPFLSLHYERFKAFCWTGEHRGTAEDTGTGLTSGSKPSSHQN